MSLDFFTPTYHVIVLGPGHFPMAVHATRRTLIPEGQKEEQRHAAAMTDSKRKHATWVCMSTH